MLKNQAIEITQEEALEVVESAKDIIHCFTNFVNFGAYWDKKAVAKLVKNSQKCAWVDHILNHNLAVISNNKRHNFDFKTPKTLKNNK